MKKIIFSVIGLALMFSLVGVTSAAEKWNLEGTYTIDFVCTSGCIGTYTHTMNITSMDLETGDFSGVGNFHTGTPTWTVSGNVNGSNVSFRIDYNSSSYYVDVIGTIESDGLMSGTATSSSNQAFTWSTISGAAIFNRHAEITSPTEGQEVSGSVSFDAVLTDDDTEDGVRWAVRKGTCVAGTNTVFGNVDGFSNSYTWVNNVFHAQADTSTWDPGQYCFVFNPTEGTREANIRLTRNFVLADAIAPIITFDKPVTGSTHSGTIHLKATCNEDCDYVNFWWRADNEVFAWYRYHYVHDDGTIFEWDLNTLDAEKADGNFYTMTNGVYYLYAAGKDLAGNWARTSEIMIIVDNIQEEAQTKADVLIESGVPGKGLENAPGLQKPFNPKSQADKHAGKK